MCANDFVKFSCVYLPDGIGVRDNDDIRWITHSCGSTTDVRKHHLSYQHVPRIQIQHLTQPETQTMIRLTKCENTQLSISTYFTLCIIEIETPLVLCRFAESLDTDGMTIYMSNDQVLREAGLRQVTCIVRERQLRLYGHMARLPAEDPAQRILSCRDPRGWTMPSGRPHASWLHQVESYEG